MANIPGLIVTEKANVALSQGEAVTFASDGVALTALNAKKIVGVVVEDVALAGAARVQVNGLALGKLGGTVTAGMALAVTAAGLFVDASTNPVVAIARKAGVSGDLVEIAL